MSTKGYCGLYLSDNHFVNTFILKFYFQNIMAIMVVLYLCACNSYTSEEEIIDFAGIQCRTIQLKNERFALSDTIRLLENDTLTHKARLQVLRKKAEELKSQSLMAADSLKQKMEVLFRTKLTDEQKKQTFLRDVDVYLQKWSCE
jgi:hypothetical protein